MFVGGELKLGQEKCKTYRMRVSDYPDRVNDRRTDGSHVRIRLGVEYLVWAKSGQAKDTFVFGCFCVRVPSVCTVVLLSVLLYYFLSCALLYRRHSYRPLEL